MSRVLASWIGIASSLATLGLFEKEVGALQIANAGIDSRTATLERMRYWQLANPPLPLSKKYLLFTQDYGALNNLRIAWEMVGVVARETGRTLVLPPAKPIYLLDFGLNMGARKKYVFPSFDFEDAWHPDGDWYVSNCSTATKVEDLVNLVQLRANVPLLTWDEFFAATGLDFEAAKAKAAQVLVRKRKGSDYKKDNLYKCHNLKEYKAVESDILYMDGEKIRQGFSCGDWDGLGGPMLPEWRKTMQDNSWKLLTHGFVWHQDAFAIASLVVDHLGLFEYNALHARYGDFQFDSAKESPSQIFRNWPSLVAPGVKSLYIATDSPNLFTHLRPPQKGLQVLTWDSLFDPKKAGAALAAAVTAEQKKYTPERWFKLMGLVEEIICTYSNIFVGTQHSSFTGHIQRMRVHAKAPNTVRLFHTDPQPAQTQVVRKRQKVSETGDIFLQLN